jgi:hypothetical protein
MRRALQVKIQAAAILAGKAQICDLSRGCIGQSDLKRQTQYPEKISYLPHKPVNQKK